MRRHPKYDRDVEKVKHEDSIKYLYFSRYLMIRYIASIFLFANLFWMILCINYQQLVGLILSAGMFIGTVVVGIEQLSKMHSRKADVPLTRKFLWLQLSMNLLLLVVLLTPFRSSLFPFAKDDNSTLLIAGILLIGVLLCVVSELKINKIINGTDRYTSVINTFKKNRQ